MPGSHWQLATHTGILTRAGSTAPRGCGFSARRDAPLPRELLAPSRGFGARLGPVTSSARGHTRPVSYYALFQGWLLLGQPPGCLRDPTAFSTQPGLWDLSRRSGLFPSRPRILAPAASLPRNPCAAFAVRFGSVRLVAPLADPAPYLRAGTPAGLHLDAFRGEPAISGFDWHFTPTHSSSPGFATPVGSGLHAALPALHPGHG